MNQAFTHGFGATLAAARESRGLSVREVAERLKLSPRQIEALEAEDWSILPDPVFVRGFVRNYAKLVGLTPEELMPAVNGAELVTQTITAPSVGVRLGSSPVARWLLLPLLLVILFVIVVVGLYTWLRQGEDTLLPTETAPMAGEAVGASTPADGRRDVNLAVGPQSPAHETSRPLSVASTPESETRQSPAAGGDATPAPPAAVEPAAQPPMQAAAVFRPASEPQATDQGQTPSDSRVSMRFAADEDAWIQVVDAKGMRFSKLVRGGTSEVVSGTPPFRLVVGNAATVNLIYNGHVIDLKPYIGEKVARLTLE